ncbi:DUF2271 domain-containing protein [Roseococcus sp. SYP-B2431]|uniref:DUF2271 domain-containing protein n=1 Tax=Roseococcus sp. SYP-B2431 TaxID=2496640 RepID=UPI00103D1BBB|nr:DUF2271 domain-containing protein [Roseococcus sp. SYP-B2431]TCI00463.1 DUF2271 domain-containing protein [Roseococcus sp. SYP-B2431]
MRLLPALAASAAVLPAAAGAAELNVTIEIPALTVAEYHRPYVALWVERPDQSAAANLAVWYAIRLRDNEGEKWLKDMRQWWRRTGRELRFPIDGVSGATRAPGRHTLRFDGASGPLAGLPAGQYNLVVEAAREVGGRELLRVPFQWPPAASQTGSAPTASAQGSTELGTFSVSTQP